MITFGEHTEKGDGCWSPRLNMLRTRRFSWDYDICVQKKLHRVDCIRVSAC
jgi:hypothetical protein